MPLAPKAPKVVARKGQKNLSCITSDTKSQVTVLACVNATGDCIPPFVIFNRKMKTELAVGEVPNTYYGYSKNGWMDMELFHDWFVNHFLCYAPSERPLLLLLDGCSSHFCPDMVKLAASEQVVLFVLPPHTTQVSQPLDKGVFSALKSSWRKVCHSFLVRNPGRVITLYDFSSLLCEAWDEAMTIKNIKSGFRVTGVYPLNEAAFVLPEEQFEEFKPEALCSNTGLSYIPFYSPQTKRKPAYRSSIGSEDIESPISTHIADGNPVRLRTQEPIMKQKLNPAHLATPAKQLPYVSPLGHTLDFPKPPSNLPKSNKSGGRVITSKQWIESAEKKQKEKKEIERQKEERRIQREEKKIQREEQKKKAPMKKKKTTVPSQKTGEYLYCLF